MDFRRLFRSSGAAPDSQKAISAATALYRRSPALSELEIYRTLTTQGIESQLAARCVEFLPIAYARLVLAGPGGIRFPDSFQRKLADGRYHERKFDSEPLWKEILLFIDGERKRGVPSKDFMAIGGRSAILHAVNDALHAGSKLEDLACGPPILPWPEDGPG